MWLLCNRTRLSLCGCFVTTICLNEAEITFQRLSSFCLSNVSDEPQDGDGMSNAATASWLIQRERVETTTRSAC